MVNAKCEKHVTWDFSFRSCRTLEHLSFSFHFNFPPSINHLISFNLSRFENFPELRKPLSTYRLLR